MKDLKAMTIDQLKHDVEIIKDEQIRLGTYPVTARNLEYAQIYDNAISTYQTEINSRTTQH